MAPPAGLQFPDAAARPSGLPWSGISPRGRPAPSPTRCPGLALEDRHEGQVAVGLVVVEAVADDEAVRDLEAHVARRQVALAALGLHQQRADREAARVARAQIAHEVLEREAGVDDVLYDQPVAPLGRRI